MKGEDMNHSLTDIAGIGESTALLLNEHGIDSVKALCKGGVKKLVQVPGFGAIRASAIITAADALKKSAKNNKKEAKTVVKTAKKAAKEKTPKLAKIKKSDKSKKTKHKKAAKKKKK